MQVCAKLSVVSCREGGCPEVFCLHMCGHAAGVTHERRQPDGSTDPTSASAACLNLDSERQCRPEPQQVPVAYIQASAQHSGRDAARLEATAAKGHDRSIAHVDDTPEESRRPEQGSSRKTAHSAVQDRSDRWAQFSSTGAEKAQGLQRKDLDLLGSSQASLLFPRCNALITCTHAHGPPGCEVDCL